ncbi:YbjN domain-containing protein [Thermodesulfobacteriota bacterium]
MHQRFPGIKITATIIVAMFLVVGWTCESRSQQGFSREEAEELLKEFSKKKENGKKEEDAKKETKQKDGDKEDGGTKTEGNCDLVTPENASNEMLKSLFDAAYMDTKQTDNGKVLVKDQSGCFVFVSGRKKELIVWLISGAFKPETPLLKKLELANAINRKFVVVRTFLGKNDKRLIFNYHLPIKGGVPKKTIVMITKLFVSIPRSAIKTCDKERILK